MAKKRDDQLLQTIHDNFAHCEEAYSQDYKRNKEDTEFALGEQWEEKVRNQRKKNKQPCLTENRLLPFALKTVNDIRKARPAITVRPVDDEGDIETAKIYSGVIRNIQYASDAETDYDTSAMNAILSGRGFLKIETRYTSYDSFDQEILINCAKDPFKSYLDPASVEMDGSDAEYYIEYDDLTKDAFKKAFPKKNSEMSEDKADWYKDDKIRVVDYWYKTYETKTLYQYIESDGTVTNTFDKRDEEAENERRTLECSIKHCRVTGREILEENDVVGRMLPIVPVYGLVAYKNSKREVYSLIHQAKDPQRMYNYWKSASAEVIALQPKAPWVGYKGSFRNNPEEWAKANTENVTFLEAEPVEMPNGALAPLPQRQPAPQGSAIMVQESAMAADGIKAALGVYEASLGDRSNEVSGVAIERRQMQGDNATYHFVDNLVTSMRQVGKIIVDMIPEVYSEQRVMRILGEDGVSSLVGVNQPVMKDGADMMPASQEALMTGEYEEYNLEVGEYDVVVDVQSSYATRRQETFALLKELMGTVPQIAQAAPDLLVKSFDVEYGEEIAERIRAVMPPELLGDDAEAERVKKLAATVQELSTKLEQTELALQVKQDNQQVENQLKMRELAIKEREAMNDTMETQAKVRKLEAEANVAIPAEASKDATEAIKNLEGQLEDLSGALTIILDQEELRRSNGAMIEPTEES